MSTKERRSRQHYSPELKLKLVKMVLEASENGGSVAALAREYDTRLILNGGKITDEHGISILNWLWEKDEAPLSDGPLLSLQTLDRLSTRLTDDRQKQALLLQCLKEGRASQAFIRSVLMTFGHADYAAFLIERNHRSIVYSDAMWHLAVQPGKGEFIRLRNPRMPIHVSV